MLRIRVLRYADTSVDVDTLDQVTQITRAQFPLATKAEIETLTGRLQQSLSGSFFPLIFVVEDFEGRMNGFASVLLCPRLKLAHLEFISIEPNTPGRGLGGMLYDRVRDECKALGYHALLFECLADEKNSLSDEKTLRENAARMKFYERFGARPLANTGYEEPSTPGGDIGAFLVMDPLDSNYRLPLAVGREYITEFLAYKYPDDYPPEKIQQLVECIQDDPIKQREPRYFRKPITGHSQKKSGKFRFALVVNNKHDIHHVRDRGYVEAPARIDKIHEELQKTGFFKELAPERTSNHHITDVHSKEYFQYLKKVCLGLPENKSIYPQVFPVRNKTRPPKDLVIRAGYYCIDTFTPLNRSAFLAARAAVDVALTAANSVLDNAQMAYALVRPPGHHAEREAFGGFCYFNSSAIAAHYFSRYGRVALLDIDFHHGNGSQDIFYQRSDVLTVSIHGNPAEHYPFFSGFEQEKGEGEGLGFNINIPLPTTITAERYRSQLKRALKAIGTFAPDYLVVALGLDTAKRDPTGSWPLLPDDFARNGAMIAELNMPTLVVQEGGYRIRSLGENARRFFEGFAEVKHK